MTCFAGRLRKEQSVEDVISEDCLQLMFDFLSVDELLTRSQLISKRFQRRVFECIGRLRFTAVQHLGFFKKRPRSVDIQRRCVHLQNLVGLEYLADDYFSLRRASGEELRIMMEILTCCPGLTMNDFDFEPDEVQVELELFTNKRCLRMVDVTFCRGVLPSIVSVPPSVEYLFIFWRERIRIQGKSLKSLCLRVTASSPYSFCLQEQTLEEIVLCFSDWQEFCRLPLNVGEIASTCSRLRRVVLLFFRDTNRDGIEGVVSQRLRSNQVEGHNVQIVVTSAVSWFSYVREQLSM